MKTERRFVLALFYCQNVPGSSEQDRQALEKKYGESIRFFPLPCSGRLEPLHMMKALEEFADAAYVVTCPEGACRYFEGNRRAKRRVGRTKSIITGIGLEAGRGGIIVESREDLKPLAEVETAWASGLRGSCVGPRTGLTGETGVRRTWSIRRDNR